MASNLKFITLLCLSAALGLCWYPLVSIASMQIESSQLLFFAFSTASLLTVSFLAQQVEKWRHNTLELLIFALTGGVSTVFIHYSFLHGNPIAVISLLCMTLSVAFFLVRLGKGQNLAAGEFITILAVILVAVATLMMISKELVFHWSLLLAILAGLGFYRLWLLNGHASSEIPIMSKLAALLIASTWLVGMVLIFSTRSTSFPLENAALFSILYGLLVLVPVMVSVVFILTNESFQTFCIWITALLTANLIGVFVYLDTEPNSAIFWPVLLLALAYAIQAIRYKVSLKEKAE